MNAHQNGYQVTGNGCKWAAPDKKLFQLLVDLRIDEKRKQGQSLALRGEGCYFIPYGLGNAGAGSWNCGGLYTGAGIA